MAAHKTVSTYNVLNAGIALVWLINGLICKVLHLVPRHQLIVGRILGMEYAGVITKVVGALEILMAIWIMSKIKPRLCAVTQVLVIAAMNTIEFMMVPDLLLFGRMNSIVALGFIAVILLNEFFVRARQTQTIDPCYPS